MATAVAGDKKGFSWFFRIPEKVCVSALIAITLISAFSMVWSSFTFTNRTFFLFLLPSQVILILCIIRFKEEFFQKMGKLLTVSLSSIGFGGAFAFLTGSMFLPGHTNWSRVVFWSIGGLAPILALYVSKAITKPSSPSKDLAPQSGIETPPYEEKRGDMVFSDDLDDYHFLGTDLTIGGLNERLVAGHRLSDIEAEFGLEPGVLGDWLIQHNRNSISARKRWLELRADMDRTMADIHKSTGNSNNLVVTGAICLLVGLTFMFIISAGISKKPWPPVKNSSKVTIFSDQ